MFERGEISALRLVICYASDIIEYDRKMPELAV